MEIKAFLIVFLVLWPTETQCYDVECADFNSGWCWSSKSRTFEKCLSCYIVDLFTMRYEVFLLTASKEWDALTLNLNLQGGTILHLPVLFNKLNACQVLNLEIIDTNTEVLDQKFFSGLATNLKSLASYQNDGLTIEADAFTDCNNLEDLNLSYNKITHIPSGAFAGLHNLFKLDLRSNKLETVNAKWFRSLKSLAILKLSNNEIKILPRRVFDKLSGVKIINLQGNQIEGISKYNFQLNTQIEWIELSWNNIRGIQVGSFDSLKHLIVVGLKWNKCIDASFNVRNSSNIALAMAPCYCKIPEIANGFVVDTFDNVKQAPGTYYMKLSQFQVICNPSFYIVFNSDGVNFNSCPDGLWITSWPTCESELNTFKVF